MYMEQLSTMSLAFKCPKAFDELLPCNGGWYCNGCHKLVHDLRGKTEEEIGQLFARQGYKMCGLLEADRIRVDVPISKWRKWLSAAVLALGFTGLYQTLVAQQLPKANATALNHAKAAAPADTNATFGVFIEAQSEFPGGMEKFQKFIAINLRPDSSCHPGQKAFFSFTVERDGSITDVKVMRSPFSQAMNAHITTVLEKSPRWRPGQQMGKVVQTRYTIPIVPIAQL